MQPYLIMAVKQKKTSEEGQALIEFILFLPFIVMMYSVVISVSSSINASINQQKITRGYFYYRVQNNSMVPKPRSDSRYLLASQFRTFSMQSTIWGEKLVGDTPSRACFKFQLPVKDSDDACDESYSGQTTSFIRVGTVYGVCGATFENQGGLIKRYPHDFLPPTTLLDRVSCELR